ELHDAARARARERSVRCRHSRSLSSPLRGSYGVKSTLPINFSTLQGAQCQTTSTIEYHMLGTRRKTKAQHESKTKALPHLAISLISTTIAPGMLCEMINRN